MNLMIYSLAVKQIIVSLLIIDVNALRVLLIQEMKDLHSTLPPNLKYKGT